MVTHSRNLHALHLQILVYTSRILEWLVLSLLLRLLQTCLGYQPHQVRLVLILSILVVQDIYCSFPQLY